MEAFPGDDSYLDILAFRAASEAVLGLVAKRKAVDREAVATWLQVALDDHARGEEIRARALFFAERMTDGPYPSSWQPDGR